MNHCKLLERVAKLFTLPVAIVFGSGDDVAELIHEIFE